MSREAEKGRERCREGRVVVRLTSQGKDLEKRQKNCRGNLAKEREQMRLKWSRWPHPGGPVSWSVVPLHQKVAGFIPGEGTYRGCRFDPQWGRVWEATNRCFFLTSMFPFLPSSLSKIKKHILSEDFF